MSDSLPQTWAEAIDRLAYTLGGRQEARDDAWEWLRQALEAKWGVDDVRELTRPQRQVAFQKLAGVVWRLEGEGELAFDGGLRRVVAAAFAYYFDGLLLDGPAWRVTPLEDRPARAELLDHADDFA